MALIVPPPVISTLGISQKFHILPLPMIPYRVNANPAMIPTILVMSITIPPNLLSGRFLFYIL